MEVSFCETIQGSSFTPGTFLTQLELTIVLGEGEYYIHQAGASFHNRRTAVIGVLRSDLSGVEGSRRGMAVRCGLWCKRGVNVAVAVSVAAAVAAAFVSDPSRTLHA